MKRLLTIVGLGLAGMALAVAVSVAAFALVGTSLKEPATVVKIPASISPRTHGSDD
jgi:UDP-N-acetyl-D-mannosaminuronate dehydrogenase